MAAQKQIAFHTLGCKLNFSETSTMAREFDPAHFRQVPFNTPADLYVINSCTVTRSAENKCRELIRKALRMNPQAKIAVVGCFATAYPESLATMPAVDLWLDNTEKFKLATHARELLQPAAGAGHSVLKATPPPQSGDSSPFIPSWSMHDRTRSFLKIQDGCDYHCAYCNIPMARGHSRSHTIEESLGVARLIADTPVREIVLSGVNIGSFGQSQGESLHDLLSELVRINGLDRIRLSSIEPDLLSDNIIELVARQPRLMPHFHLPLQSGSDQVLQSMGRRYDTRLFASRVDSIRRLMPHACIAADLIAGLPGETHAMFEESRAFVETLDLSYIHVFTYSERRGTRAVSMKEQVPLPERKERARRMRALSQEKKLAFYTRFQGTEADVLWESGQNQDCMYGFTENYIRVRASLRPGSLNQIEKVRLGRLLPETVFQAE